MIYELVIEDENIDEIFAISLVEAPAIESNFVYFDKDKVNFAAVSNEKRLVMGPILIPDKQIVRVDGEGKPYWVFFRAETIEKLAQNYLLKGYNSETTLEHNGKVEDISLVESWIVENRTKDKSALYNLSMPAGTWMGIMKINNDEIWDEYVKTGKVKGFSIEGVFEHKLVSASSQEPEYFAKDISDLTEDEAKDLLNRIHSMLMPTVELESFADYPEAVSNNAKRGIELNDKVNNKCATQVGKVRAQQLANGEAVSVETIKRMYSYLSRAETYYDESDTEACGTISYLLWGGLAAKRWSESKLKELGLFEGEQPTIDSSYAGEASGSISNAVL